MVIAGDRIEDVTDPAGAEAIAGLSVGDGVRVIDGGGRVAMPGLTDAHVHLMGAGNTVVQLATADLGLVYANTLAEARRMLLRGFTAVRDMGGNLAGVKVAIDRGVAEGPRIYPSLAMVSQTGGHGDFAPVYEPPPSLGGRPSRGDEIGFTRVADGPALVLAAVREQLKRGASQVKLTAGGGVSSLYDPLDTTQFTEEEMRAAVRAADDWGTYVAVHVYTDDAVRRAVDAGVRSIEHAHLVEEDTVRLLADHEVWLSTQPFAEHDHTFREPHQVAKNRQVCSGTDRLLGWARKHGVKTAFGTDLLFEPAATDRQIEMLVRLADHMTPLEALTMATSTNAELFRLSGGRDPYGDAPLGVLRPGAWADLLVVDGDPTSDLAVVRDHRRSLRLVVANGRVVKNTLDEPRAPAL